MDGAFSSWVGSVNSAEDMSTYEMPVSNLECLVDTVAYLTRCGLPCAIA